jgi:6-phosphogluconolactonase
MRDHGPMGPAIVVAFDASAAADYAAELLIAAVRAGRSLGLSGGSTPGAAYRRAAALEPDWSRAALWLVDERCVPADDALANTRLVTETVLDAVAAPPVFHRVATELGAQAAAARYDAELALEGVPSLVILGVGADGHTASLFPGAPALDERAALAVAVAAGMEPYVPRITLTLPALARADDVVFLVTGEAKALQVRRAFGEPPARDVPASLARSASGTTTVVLDEAAAGLL